MRDDFTLECQSCGEVLVRISREDSARHQRATRAVAENPYNYIRFCKACIDEELHIDQEYR